jgi:hypothetical protein
MNSIIRTQEELQKYIALNPDKLILATNIALYGNGYAVIPVEIKLNAGEDDEKVFATDDVWSFDGEKFTLTKHGFDKIAGIVGLSFTSSKILQREVDETGRITYIKHEVVYKRATTTGIDVIGTATGEYNYYEDLARLRYKYDVKDKKGNVIKEKGSPNIEMVEKRRNYAGGLAETNAKIRALNEALPELPKSFTKHDLAKTLVAFRVVVDIEGIISQNKALKDIYQAKLLGLSDVIYQPAQNQNILVDARKVELTEQSQNATPQPPQIQQQITANNIETTTLDKEIEELIVAKKYQGKALNVWKDFDEATKQQFLEHLKSI